jgi:hypothetical protein
VRVEAPAQPPRYLYRGGSGTPHNLVPRLSDMDGLSTFDTLERAARPGEKAQVIDPSRLKTLLAYADPADPGHYALRPGDNAPLLRAWAATKEAQRERQDRFLHPLTEEVAAAIVREARRPRW